MASNLVALSVSDVNNEAAALLAARLALLKAAAMEQPTNAVDEAERAFLKNLIAAASASGSPEAADKLAEKLFAEWTKVSAERRKREERTAAIEDIGEFLDDRWDELAASQPCGALENYLKKYKAALEERRSDYEATSNLITAELEWSDEKLDAIQGPAAKPAAAAKAGRKKAAQKK